MNLSNLYASYSQKKPNIVVAVSEGIRDKDGRYIGEGTQNGVADAFGHKYLAGTAKQLEYLVKQTLGCKVRSIELSLPQRCAAHLLSKCDITESVQIGKAAVSAAAAGKTACVAVFRRQEGAEYKIETDCVPVKEIANKIKKVPESMIAGNTVSEEALQYLQPLIIGQINIPYKNGMPQHFII